MVLKVNQTTLFKRVINLPVGPGNPSNITINPGLYHLWLMSHGINFGGDTKRDNIRFDGLWIIGQKVVLAMVVILGFGLLQNSPRLFLIADSFVIIFT